MSSHPLAVPRRILANTVLLSASKGVADVATFLFFAYFAQAFGTVIVGAYSWAMAIGGLLSVMVSLGLHTVMLRECSRSAESESKYIGSLLMVEGALAAAIFAVLFGVASVVAPNEEDRNILLLIGTYHILVRLAALFDTRFRIHEEMQFIALWGVVERLTILIAGVALTVLFRDPVITLAAFPSAAMLALMLSATTSIRRYGPPNLKLDPGFIKGALSSSMPFLILLVISQAFDRLGIILLSALTDAHTVGVYSAPDRLLTALTGMIIIFGATIFPVLSRLMACSREEASSVYNGAVRVMAVLTLPAATAVFLFSDAIVATLFGPGFDGSAPVLRVLALTLPLLALNQLSSQLLIANFRQNELIRLALLALMTLLGLGLILIPNFGELGLAVARVTTGLLTAIWIYRTVARAFLTLPTLRSAVASLMACIAAGVVFHLLADSSPWISGSTALTTLVTMLVLLGAVARDDMVVVRRIFARQ